MHAKFSRPSIEVGSDEPKREWRTSHAGTLRAGDIIQGFGKIEKFGLSGVSEDPDEQVYAGNFVFTNPLGETRAFGWSTVVFAFTASGDDATQPPKPAPEFFGA